MLAKSPEKTDPQACFNRKLSNIQSCGARALDNILAMRLQSTLLSLVKVSVTNPTPWFCIEGVCPSFIGNISAAGGGHTSRDAALLTTPLLYDASFAKK
jgi:hypothetical protein